MTGGNTLNASLNTPPAGGDCMKLREVLQAGTKILEMAEIGEAATDAWYLLERVCEIDRNGYYMNQEEEVSAEEQQEYEILISKRAEHIPLQYITGVQEFMGYSFKVTPEVLIPRFDTEILVEQVLKKMEPGMSVLDMCTGSGCILISLLKEMEGCTGTGVDLSKQALLLAKENARALQVNANWIKSDMFEEVEGTYDIIVSNPPYIKSLDILDLEPEVREFEPMSALDGKEDGLFFYEILTRESVTYLKDGGWLCLEIGCQQAADVSSLLEKNGFEEIVVIKDLAGLDRVVMGHL